MASFIVKITCYPGKIMWLILMICVLLAGIILMVTGFTNVIAQGWGYSGIIVTAAGILFVIDAIAGLKT